MAEEKLTNPLDTPIGHLVQEVWLEFENGIKAAQVTESEILLYLLWSLDTIKTQEEDFTKKISQKTFKAIRCHFHSNKFSTPGEDIQYVTDLVIALTLHCLGLLLSKSSQNRTIYTEIISNLGDLWPKVKTIKYKIAEVENTSELQNIMVPRNWTRS